MVLSWLLALLEDKLTVRVLDLLKRQEDLVLLLQLSQQSCDLLRCLWVLLSDVLVA